MTILTLDKNAKRIQKACKTCGRLAVEIGSFEFITGGVKYSVSNLVCGHSERREIKEYDYTSITSLDGKKLYPFQIATEKFAEATDFRCLIAHEPGLGKTPITGCALFMHPELLPAIIVTKPSIKVQFTHELIRWAKADPRFTPQRLDGSKDKPIPNWPIYIIGYDTLRNCTWLEDLNVKTVVLDECQAIKNADSARTQAVRKLCKGKDHIIGLSATPIKNNAAEYFPVLNLIRPDLFPNLAWFLDNWVESYGNKYGGIKRYKLDAWKEKTKSFIIRYEKADVLPDLPKINRTFSYTELEENFQSAYGNTVDEIEDLDESKKDYAQNALALLSKLRHLTGLSKVPFTVDQVEEFITGTDRKLTIFVHHKDVGELLKKGINTILEENGFLPCVQITSDMSGDARQKAIELFRDERRVLIASTLASGEGINLQFCSDAIFHERQWNPANEEQAEGRFPRPGSVAESVHIAYATAIGTIDEFFAEIVERKRQYVNETMTGREGISWNESGLIKELTGLILAKGKKKWKR